MCLIFFTDQYANICFILAIVVVMRFTILNMTILFPPCIFYFICCYNSISEVEYLSCNSFLAASYRSINQKKDLYKSKMPDGPVLLSKNKSDGLQQLLPMDDSPTAAKSFTDSQLELFDYLHGTMILHLLSTLMFVPSLVAWLQVGHILAPKRH